MSNDCERIRVVLWERNGRSSDTTVASFLISSLLYIVSIDTSCTWPFRSAHRRIICRSAVSICRYTPALWIDTGSDIVS